MVLDYKPILYRLSDIAQFHQHQDCLQQTLQLNMAQTDFRRSTSAEPISSNLPLHGECVLPLCLWPFIGKNRRPVCLLLTEQKTHLDLPLHLSCCHQICLLIGLQGGMVSIKIQGWKKGGEGSDNNNHTQGFSGAQEPTGGVDLRKSRELTCVSEQSRHVCIISKHGYTPMTGLHNYHLIILARHRYIKVYRVLPEHESM